MKNETITHIIEQFEASQAYTAVVKADAVEILKALTKETVLAQAGAYKQFLSGIAVKYAGQAETLGYFRALSLDYLADVEDYAQDALTRLANKEAANDIA
jgi:hypothetical protein